jgi:multidrug efflux pump subunit AcrA (membrane-fusion protein)
MSWLRKGIVMKGSLTILALIGATVALTAWRLNTIHKKSTAVLAVVKQIVGDLQTAVTATGTLYPSHSVDIKFDGQEIVEDLKVKEGDHVSAGQVLAVVDTRVLDHTRLQNLQTLQKDSASLLQAEAAFHREERDRHHDHHARRRLGTNARDRSAKSCWGRSSQHPVAISP